MVIAVGKFFASTIEKRLLATDLIKNFYQVEKTVSPYADDRAREGAPPVRGIRDRKGSRASNDEEGNLKNLEAEWKSTMNLKQRMGKLVQNVSKGKPVDTGDLRTIQEVILSRENFKVGYKEWAKSIAN